MSFQDGGVQMEQVLPKEEMVEGLKEQASLAAMRRMSGEGRESLKSCHETDSRAKLTELSTFSFFPALVLVRPVQPCESTQVRFFGRL